MNLPASRHMDPRWNAALDLLTETWNKLGPDFTVSYLRMSARAEIDAYGLVQMEMAARDFDGEQVKSAATREAG